MPSYVDNIPKIDFNMDNMIIFIISKYGMFRKYSPGDLT
jgi:hypothetical protein